MSRSTSNNLASPHPNQRHLIFPQTSTHSFQESVMCMQHNIVSNVYYSSWSPFFCSAVVQQKIRSWRNVSSSLRSHQCLQVLLPSSNVVRMRNTLPSSLIHSHHGYKIFGRQFGTGERTSISYNHDSHSLQSFKTGISVYNQHWLTWP